ncbi:unnamed protein product, partial [Mesorhabditis belari]|uniref:C2H2-type domain-containing protein n=1 Tax=Mesorhabditis belari TaxID=2138241 RepID=A0AAF3F2Y4_9BILA
MQDCRFTCSHYVHASFYATIAPHHFPNASVKKEVGAWCQLLDASPTLFFLAQCKERLASLLAKAPPEENIIDVVGDDSFEPVIETRSNLSMRREIHLKYCQNRNSQVKLLQKIIYRDKEDGSTFEITFPFLDGVEACADLKCGICVPNYNQSPAYMDQLAAEHDDQKPVAVLDIHPNFDEMMHMESDEKMDETYITTMRELTAQKAYICPVCSKVLKSKYSYKAHVLKQHENKDAPYHFTFTEQKRGRPANKSQDHEALTKTTKRKYTKSVRNDEEPTLYPRKYSIVQPEAMFPISIGTKYRTARNVNG